MTRQARQHLAKTDNSTAEQARQEQVHSSGPEGVLGVAGHGRAEEHTMISDASAVERPRRRGGGKRGQEHGEGACLVRGLPEHVLSPTIWPSVCRLRPSLAT